MDSSTIREIAGIESSLAETLASIEIPPRPIVLDKVMAEMQLDVPDFRRLASLIQADVGMSASLLKTANSPVFGYRTRVSTVREALTMLGLINVLRALAGIALRQAAPETPLLKGFWESSSRVALLSGWLVKQLGVRDGIRSEDAYTFGLFHDCGIPVLLKALDGYEATYQLATSQGERPLTEIESEHHTLNHAMVGCALAHSWFLPEVHVQAILGHHEIGSLAARETEIPPGSRRLIALAHLAEMLAVDGQGAAEHEWQRMGDACLAVLDCSPERIAEIRPAALDVLKAID